MEGQLLMESPLGKLWIEETNGHISKVHFLQDEEILPEGNPSHLTNQAAQQLNEFFAGTRTIFDFPIQQDGTDFQQRVWAELLKIPAGKTISYLELARCLGDEKCIRAAASANGKNDLAIVVPCHRVIGADGRLVGYAGGLWRKKWLLEHEKSMLGLYKQATLF